MSTPTRTLSLDEVKIIHRFATKKSLLTTFFILPALLSTLILGWLSFQIGRGKMEGNLILIVLLTLLFGILFVILTKPLKRFLSYKKITTHEKVYPIEGKLEIQKGKYTAYLVEQKIVIPLGETRSQIKNMSEGEVLQGECLIKQNQCLLIKILTPSETPEQK